MIGRRARPLPARLAAVLAALAAALAHFPPAVRAAEEPRPQGLAVVGGEGWRPENGFRVVWSRDAPGERLAPTTGAGYVLHDAAGYPVASGEATGPIAALDGIRVPGPGAWRLELRLRSGALLGPPASVWLRFDPTPPPPPRARAAVAWFGAGRPALLELAPPAADLPPSGLRGYAIALGRGAVPAPCPGGICAPERVGWPASAPFADLGLPAEGEGAAVVVAVSGAGLASEPVTVPVRVDATPPSVRLEGVPDGWASGPVRVLARAADLLSGMAAAGPGGAATGISVDGAPPSLVPGPEAATVVAGEGEHEVEALARDAAGNASPPGAPGARAVVRIDRGAPHVAFAPPSPADPERIVATVSDPLSGPGSRGWIGVRPTGSTAAFEPLPTRVEAGRLVARWDSDAVEPGSYELRAVAFDAAGNRAVSDRRADGARMVLPAPLRRPTELRLGFGGRRLVWHRCAARGERRRCRREVRASFDARPARRLLPYGRAVRVAGALLGPGGEPLAGEVVEIVEAFAPGAAQATRVSAVRTGPDGYFAARLAPGPARRVEARFGGARLHSRAAAGPLWVGARAGVALRASAAVARVGGRPIVFRGRVLAAGAERLGGQAVQLQFRVVGLPWREFRTVRTDAAGRFRYRYAFADDDSRGARFAFRAVVPAAPGWPYEPAASRPVFVTGR